jgi:heptosyltransferase I
MRASPKILIIRLSSLGDILHTLPAFADLRASFPEAQIDWLVARRFKFLLSTVAGIDSLHELDTHELLRLPPNRSAWRRHRDLIRELRIQRYDYSLDFQGLLKTAFLGFLSGSKARLGFSKALVREVPAHWFYHRTLDKPSKEVHVLELNRRLSSLAGAHAASSRCDFIVPEADLICVDSLLRQNQLKDFIIINPGGGWPTKRWSPERYGMLAKRVREELGFSVVVTTGPGEEALYQAIAEKCESALHFPVPFLQLIPLLKKARLFIGGDTGPFHLACAVNTAVVGIFGPTSPVRNGPWQDGEETVIHNLPCGDCYGRTCSVDNTCMDIAVDEVFAAVIRRLGHGGGLNERA